MKRSTKVADDAATLPLDAPQETKGEILPPEKPARKARGTAVATQAAAPISTTAPAAPMSENAQMISVIREIAMNPAVDVDKMRAVLDMQERIMDRQAKANFDAEFARMQPELPTVDKKGRIEIKAKDAKGERNGPVQQSSKFAMFEDINEAVRPILGKYGFGIRFKTGLDDTGRVKVVGVLSGHGHREESEFFLPHDSSGSKNNVQAIGSSTSYGKRYALCALLNITTRGQDDDAMAGGGPSGPGYVTITPQQAELLRDYIDQVEAIESAFVDHLKVEKLDELPADRFGYAVDQLRKFGNTATKKKLVERDQK